jgi:hypothetical protein
MPRDGQTLRTFIKNHAKQIYACDFLTQHAALFAVVYIFVVMEIPSRQIVLINVTEPGLGQAADSENHAVGRGSSVSNSRQRWDFQTIP